jgi:hypothetical protein
MSTNGDVFGSIKTGYQVEQAVMETLRDWMPTAIQELELQNGRELGLIQPPRYYARPRFDGFPKDWHPMIVVVSPGLAEAPLAEGDGRYRGWFVIGLGCTAIARDDSVASFLSKLYVAAARWVMLNQQTLRDANGVNRASGIEWMDETYDDSIVQDEDQSIRASYGIFQVLVEDLVTRQTGVTIQVPGDQWPTANLIEVDVNIAEDS